MGTRPVLRLQDLTAIAEHVRGALVLVVELPDDKIRRKVYLSASAAEKAMRRASARGHHATIVLAELTPVYAIDGEEDSS